MAISRVGKIASWTAGIGFGALLLGGLLLHSHQPAPPVKIEKKETKTVFVKQTPAVTNTVSNTYITNVTNGTNGSSNQTLQVSNHQLSISEGNTVALPDNDTQYGVGNGLLQSGTTFSRVSGTAVGQIEYWDGSAWHKLDPGTVGQTLTMLGGVPAWQTGGGPGTDNSVGNEVVGPTGANSGLSLSGTGSALDPFTLAVNSGSGLTISSNLLHISSPTCNGATQKLGWSGAVFACGTDENTTYSAGAGISLAGSSFNNTGILGVSVIPPLQSSGGQNPTLSCPSCLTATSFFTINGSSPSTTPQTISGGDNLTFSAGLNMLTVAGPGDNLSIATVNNPTFSGLVTAGAVATSIINPSSTLLISGGMSAFGQADIANDLVLGGAFMPGSLAGSLGDLLVSQGGGTSPQWQSFNFNAIADARIDLQKGVPDGLASLDATGKVPGSQLPAIAITNTFVATFLDSPGGAVDSCTEHVATVGDFCVVTSANKSYVLSATPASVVGNWVELLSSSSGVTSVNGQTGNVSLTAANGLTLVGDTSFQLGGTLTGATTIQQAGSNIAFTGTGNLGVGVSVPAQKVDISGNLQFSGALMPAGNGGTAGELLVSQGGSSAPQWLSPANITLGVVRDVTPNQGLVRSGAGNPGNPYTLGLQPCSALQVLLFNGAGWDCGNQQTYSAGTGLTLLGNTFNLANTGVSPGIYGSASQYPILTIDAQGRITTAGLGTVPSYSAGAGISLAGSTFSNTGLLTITGTGAVSATSGQNPVISFADGTSAGQVWAWDGSSWQLTSTSQSFSTGTAGNDFNIVSAGGSHVFNLPNAGPTSRGVVSTAAQTFTGIKTFDTQLAVASGALLVINGTAGADPTGANGSMYYNSTMGKFRCFEAGAWKDCISSGQQPWTACSPLVIAAITTAPSKANTTQRDCIRYRFVGAKTIITDFIYSASSVVGTTAGAGDYLFQLPPSTSFSAVEHPFYTGPLDDESDFVTATPFVIRGDFPGQVRSAPNGGSGGTTFIVPYDATRFRIVADLGNNIRAVGGSNQPLNQAGYTIIGRFNMEIP